MEVNDARIIELLDQIRCGLIDVEDAIISQKRDSRPTWEYRQLIKSGATIKEVLNRLGAEGWELVSIFETPSRSSYDAFLKRKVEG